MKQIGQFLASKWLARTLLLLSSSAAVPGLAQAEGARTVSIGNLLVG